MKTILCAIAKNEAAYLSEWIHYHLEIGFDKVVVYVNGTNDKSIDILNNIKKKYPVDYVVADYINDGGYKYDTERVREKYLKANKMQSCAYNEAIDLYKDEFDYAMFMDIDEFFYSKEFSICDFISKQPVFGTYRVPWLLESGDNSSFIYPLKSTIRYSESKEFKSIINLNNVDNLKIINSHVMNIGGEVNLTCLPDDAYILHRWLRSESEYISTLLRGDNIYNTMSGLKLNRRGWSNEFTHTLKTSEDKVTILKSNYEDFLDECEIRYMVTKSKEKIENNILAVEEIRDNHLEEHKNLKKIFQGTRFAIDKEKVLTSNKGIVLKSEQINLIRDSAVKLESIDLQMAHDLMEIAFNARPKGPFIKKKLLEYKKLRGIG